MNAQTINERKETYDRRAYLLAGCESIGPVVMEALALSSNYLVRKRLAENASTHPALLAALSCDRHPEVRIAVTEHPSAPDAILEELAHDNCADVRYAMAENAGTPMHILEKLARDENPYVSSRATRTLSVLKTQPSTDLALGACGAA